MHWLFVLALTVGCGRIEFDDRARPVLNLPNHVSNGTAYLGPRSSIDTSELSVDGVRTNAMKAVDLVDGSEVALLEIAELTIESADTVVIVGSRPLVIAARHQIRVDGVLDASAHGARPGPGVSSPSGDAGLHVAGDVCDHGGGGGGHQTSGGDGGRGDSCGDQARPRGGSAMMGLLIAGGSGGRGASSACGSAAGGGGGGAIQLSSLSITIFGLVTAGGGGGAGGFECGDGDAGSGAGGGAGGTIVVDGESIEVTGQVLALGGGGGAGGNGNIDNGPVGAGEQGADGRELAGVGGRGPAPNAGVGGVGGSNTSPPTSGGSVNHNGGGGGGAAGHITVLGRIELGGTIDPTP